MTRVLFALLIAAVALFFVDLGGSSIWDANEAFYVETPREMIESGDYVFPSFNYEPRLNKPILSYWIVAGLYRMFGISVGVQRLGIAIGALLIVGAGIVLGWLAADGGLRRERRLDVSPPLVAALIAGLGLAVDPRIVMFARRIFIDVWITAFMALTLAFFALSERFPERRRLFLLLMYVSVGLGVLTKGPVAALLPGLVFLLYLIVHRELRRASEMMMPAGLVIVFAIVAPWYVALYRRTGWTYIASFFIGENVGRFTDGIGQAIARPWWFYVPVVFGDTFPLSLFLIPAAVLWWRHMRGDRIQTLLWLWILTLVTFFSLSHDKQDLYIFPIAPAVAALGASAIARGDFVPRWIRGTSLVLAMLVGIAGVAVLYLFQSAGRVYALESTAWAGVAAVVGSVVAIALWVRARRPLATIVAVLATLLLVNWLFVLRVLPEFEQYKPAPALAEYLGPQLGTDDVIATYEVALPSLVYYLRRHIDPYYSRDLFVAAVRRPVRVFGILSEDDYQALAGEIGSETCVVHRVPTFDVKLREILARDPVPHLVVVTNRCEAR